MIIIMQVKSPVMYVIRWQAACTCVVLGIKNYYISNSLNQGGYDLSSVQLPIPMRFDLRVASF